MMPERKLIVVFLVTREVDSLVPFYRDILGLKVIRYEPGHSAWFDTGAAKLVIHCPESEAEGHDYLPEAQTVMWLQPGEGVPAMAQSLEKAGVELLHPQRATNYFYFRDPEGRLLGFHQAE